MIWSALNVECEKLVTKQPFIYDGNSSAKVNFFTKKRMVICWMHEVLPENGWAIPPCEEQD